MRVVPVERIAAPDPETFRREILPQSRPFILTGLSREWGTSAWTPELIKARVGDALVTGRRSRGTEHETTERRFRDLLDDIVAMPQTGELHTLYNEALLRPDFYPLLEDVRMPGYVDVSKLAYASLWMSGRGGFRSKLHFDSLGCHNLNIQLKGSKKVWLFAPEDGEFLYPNTAVSGPGENFFCQPDVGNVDLERFPDLAKATCYEGVMNESDAVYHPALWFHSFLHMGDFNVNANFWWYQLAYEPTGQFRRWAFLEFVTAFILDKQRRTGRSISPEDLPPEVAEFVLEMEQYLLRMRSPVLFALADNSTWQALQAFRQARPDSPFFPGPLPERYPLGIGDPPTTPGT